MRPEIPGIAEEAVKPKEKVLEYLGNLEGEVMVMEKSCYNTDIV